MKITASMVKDLRTKTGAGMMDCKKALVEADGDVEKAVDILREKGLSQAAKNASRVAAEGAVVSAISEDGKTGTIVEVNCETDFVGSNDDFKALAHSIAQQIIAVNPADVDALLASDMNGKSVKDTVTEAVAKIGENISVRRFVRYESAEGKVYSYIHGGGKIGVLVELKGGDDELGKDIAMQVAAANPSYVDEASVPAEVVAKEKEIMLAQMAGDPKNANKPDAVKQKMIEGKIKKFFKENCLVDQEFVKDGDLTVAQYTAKVAKDLGGEIKIVKFARFVKGEGLEKRADDFASEVASMVK